jgi:hypothetical protein
MTKTTQPYALQSLPQGLAAVLTRVDPPELSRRAAAVAAAVGPLAGAGHAAATPAPLGPALAPLPCRFSTAQLVELLKQPTCVGPVRRVILDHLENRYHQKFTDHWDFDRFAKKQKLGLDFTSPPQRLTSPAGGGTK